MGSSVKPFYYVPFMVIGLILVYLAPFSDSYSVYVIFGNFLFWSSLLSLLFKSALKGVFNYLTRNITGKGYVIYGIYLTFHYVVYSIALERLLTAIYGQLFSISSSFVSFNVSPYYPGGPYATLINLLFNPSLALGFPPNFFLELTFYSISMGFLIGGIVTATILRVLDMSKFIKVRAILVAPVMGVIAGGSCCVSIPLILATAIPAANVLLFVPSGETALFLAYIFLPPVTTLALALHFRTLFPKPPKQMRMVERKEGK
ncbi:hypothetical protein [Stygiolobus caldivivus]|uniref:Uncharacterized protein n=1 Tax=Stygiolobus caldivivus TaxID=2824673 RepID=A0A8D5ZD69_9CREN|nr:hypothetical protein [Stygiolobus caldivivus]BCU68938.1 hypothetical protein KN1_02350 [Stygiolobus caldivivus]